MTTFAAVSSAWSPGAGAGAGASLVGDGCPSKRAMPQSVRYTCPYSPTMTFAGFTSQWSTPRSCAYDRASQTLVITSSRT
jgi:hypothetical protein